MFPKIIASILMIVLSTPLVRGVQYNFNSDWLVNVGDAPEAEAMDFDDAGWKKVTLPYAWNEDSAFNVYQDHLPTGIAWYRKHFRLPDDAAGKKVYLEFQGIRQAGEFYLNGEWIGRSENGVMAFGFDVTDQVKPAPAENVISVRIDNDFDYKEKETGARFQWNAERRFYANYGGINRNVVLHVVDKLHQTLPLYSNLGTTGVYVYARDIDVKGKSAKITAESQVKNDHAEAREFSYEVSINDAEGKTIQTFQGGEQTLAAGETKTISASAKVSNLNFWSWGYGYLYDVTTTLKVDGKPVDKVVTRTGFRKLEFGNGAIKLNDRTMHIHGYAQRSTNEWPALGNAVPPWMSDLTNALAVEGNSNLVRWMHVTPAKQDIESCDRVGLPQAMPGGDAENDVKGAQWRQRVNLMRDTIIYNRNNPSIIMWEGGNEAISEEHMSELNGLRDRYDPHGGRASGCREMLDSKVAEWGGEMFYINKSAGKPMWATEYSRDEGLRKYWDVWTPPYHKAGQGPRGPRGEGPRAYNHNQDTHAIENVRRWFEFWRERPGTGLRVNGGGVNIYYSDSNTHPRGPTNYRSGGEVDAMRLPKDGFFAHKVMWDGWVNVERPSAHILGHWNYEPGVKKPIYVVSSADKVELFINNRSQGFGEQSMRFLYTWEELAFEPGEIKAVGYDSGGGKVCEYVLETVGDPVSIKLTPRTAPDGWKADGADMALIDVEVVDVQGRRCPTAMHLIQFDLQGPAEWRGGIAAGPADEKTFAIAENYILSKELPVENGINRVILRSLPQAGEIILSARSSGLKSTTVRLESTSFATHHGLANTMPDVGLKARYDRGPTPEGDSVIQTRKAVRIIGATDRGKTSEVIHAFDDNEKTSWSSDGDLANAWIEFELERAAPVSEITLKFANMRSSSYPISIHVDGKPVFTGISPKTLGYATFPIPPTHGKTVRVSLTGASDNKDDFGMIEADGKKLRDKTKGKNAIQIYEIEIYEPVPSGH
ncbi:MAG: DUF4982 domain-containing protein [Luteolibacter sp.]